MVPKHMWHDVAGVAVAVAVLVVVWVLLSPSGGSAAQRRGGEKVAVQDDMEAEATMLVVLVSEVSSDASGLIDVFEKAAFPHQLRVVVWESARDDAEASALMQSYATRVSYTPSRRSYVDRIQVHRCRWKVAPPPCEQVRRMVAAYREGERYVVSMLHPARLVRGWDRILLRSWLALGDSKSVLTFPLTRAPSFTACAPSLDPMFLLPVPELRYVARPDRKPDRRGSESGTLTTEEEPAATAYRAALWCGHLSFSRVDFWTSLTASYTSLPLCCEVLVTAHALRRGARLWGLSTPLVTSRSETSKHARRSVRRWRKKLQRDDKAYDQARKQFRAAHALLRRESALHSYLGVRWTDDTEVELSGRSLMGIVDPFDGDEVLTKYGSFSGYSRARQGFT